MAIFDSVRFVGHALVSADGMIGDTAGEMPPALRNDGDWTRFQSALDQAALVVLGRKGHARHANPGRRRLVLTRSVDRLERDRTDARAWLWNPAGLGLGETLGELGVSGGTVAITGGTGTFDLFAPHFDSFDLAEMHHLVLPGGTPCFSRGHPRIVLASHGLRPGRTEVLDPPAAVTVTTWTIEPTRQGPTSGERP